MQIIRTVNGHWLKGANVTMPMPSDIVDNISPHLNSLQCLRLQFLAYSQYIQYTFSFLGIISSPAKTNNMFPNPRGAEVIRVTIACGILEAAAVTLRFLARWKSNAKFGPDDWVMLITLIPAYAMLVAGWYSTSPPSAHILHSPANIIQ